MIYERKCSFVVLPNISREMQRLVFYMLLVKHRKLRKLF